MVLWTRGPRLTRWSRETYKWILKSLRRLIIYLGEAITRREGLGTPVSTDMFLFWAADDISAVFEIKEKEQALNIAGWFLRNYVASVSVFEDM